MDGPWKGLYTEMLLTTHIDLGRVTADTEYQDVFTRKTDALMPGFRAQGFRSSIYMYGSG